MLPLDKIHTVFTAALISESFVVLDEVVVMCVAVGCALFEFDTLIRAVLRGHQMK